MPRTALLVVDVQVGFLEGAFMVHQAQALLQKVQRLIAQANEAGVPILFIQHNESPEYDGPIHPTIAPADADAMVFKLTADAFYETDLQEKLARLQIERVVLAGLQTELCMNATAQSAHQLGYEVVIVADAHSTLDSDTETAAAIIARYTQEFSRFARLVEAETLTFHEL